MNHTRLPRKHKAVFKNARALLILTDCDEIEKGSFRLLDTDVQNFDFEYEENDEKQIKLNTATHDVDGIIRGKYNVRKDKTLIHGHVSPYLARSCAGTLCTVRDWMEEESKLNPFIKKLDESAELTNKEIRFVQDRRKRIPVSRSDLKLHSKKNYRQMKLEAEFRAANGWL
ncbi:hypothetical protein Trydic_g11393 [Trypoxylus dichotomus]